MTLEIDLVRALREPEYREEVSAELESDITSMTMLDAADEIERLRTWLEVIRDSPELLVITERKAAALALSGNPAPQRRDG